jgi:hypothetical protein
LPLTTIQPQQHGDKALPLAETETTAEGLKELAQGVAKAYNGLGHGLVPGQRVLMHPITLGKAIPASLSLAKYKDCELCSGRD